MSDAHSMQIAFKTFGCRSNHADILEIQSACDGHGFNAVQDIQVADVVVVNTCSVTNEADKEALRTLRYIKRINPVARLVVTGCMAEMRREDLAKYADAIVGTGRRDDVVKAILGLDFEDLSHSNSRTVQKKKKSSFLNGTMHPCTPGPGEALGDIVARSRFHLRIQEGCENNCTFCIIPMTRGGWSSRAEKEVLRDISFLRDKGYREIVFTGTHLGAYGNDFGGSLALLLEKSSSRFSDMRFRLSSIDPNNVDGDLLELLETCPNICSHLHICMQAFSDKILRRMCRQYTLAEAMNTVLEVLKRRPRIALGTDIITGFPGETEEEWKAQVNIFKESSFNYAHVFPWSERDMTAAPKLYGHIDVKKRRHRAAHWRTVSSQKWVEYCRSFHGEMVEVVVEGALSNFNDSEKLMKKGTSSEFISVEWEGEKEQFTMPGELCLLYGDWYNEKKGRLVCELSKPEVP